jgi:hypothetical protein
LLQKTWKKAPFSNSLTHLSIEKEGPGRAVVKLNQVQQVSEFENQKQAILEFLKKELENDLLELDYKLESEALPERQITPADRFAELAQENPVLIELEKLLELRLTSI